MKQHDDFVPYMTNGGDWVRSEDHEEKLHQYYIVEFWQMLQNPALRNDRFEMIVLDALAEYDVHDEYDASINQLAEMIQKGSSHAKMIASKACDEYVAYMCRAK